MPRILLCIDDDTDFLHVLCRALEVPGVIVVGAPTAEAALAMCAAQHVDLVVADVNLPTESGLDAIDELRAGRANLPIVIVTASDSAETARRALEMRATAYVTKPLDLAALRRLVVFLLGEDQRKPRTASSNRG